jgi:hypothetical protein
VLYEGVRAFQAVGEPDAPEKAMAGRPGGLVLVGFWLYGWMGYLPSFTASVAAPTVPETSTARPRFEPTLGPVTAISGAPLKNLGARVWRP